MSDFHYFTEALDQLKATSSINEKVKILKELKEKDVEIAKDFFQKALDPQFQFGLKRFPDYDKSKKPDRPDMYHFVECAYTRLLEDKTDIKTFIASVLETLTEDEYNLFRKICLKDPDCGVSAGLVNRVWKGLIDTGIKLCKAVAYSDKALEKITFPCYVQKKEDGARCLAFVRPKDGTVNFFSSNGKTYTGLETLEYRILEACHDYINDCCRFTNNFVLDGELLVISGFGNFSFLPRKVGNGILNKSIKGTISEKEASKVYFVIWDFIPEEEYYGRSYPRLTYSERMQLLHKFNDPYMVSMYNKPFGIVPTKEVNSKSEIIEEFKKRLSYGDEGVIVKNKEFIWQGKRIADCVKMKLDFDVTLKVTAVLPGGKGTKYENCLGALYCESAEGDIQVSVGSGFSDEFRKKFYEKYKDKNIKDENIFVEVRSNGIIQAMDETWSLFLPRFIEIRTDKDEADTATMIRQLEQAALHLEND